MKKIICRLPIFILILLLPNCLQAQIVATMEVLPLAKPLGFGETTTGGMGGEIYQVTTLKDDGHGSLREGARSESPLHIVFAVSGTIDLQSRLDINSNITIDGRGQRVAITGYGFRIANKNNIIIENVIFRDGKDDAIQISHESTNIWVDHCSLKNYSDGLIDITEKASNVTVSWSKFEDHANTMLIGSGAKKTYDRGFLKVTLHNNYFYHTGYRNPRVRFGKVHTFNNYYYHWKGYAMGSSIEGQLISEANIFEPRKSGDRAIITNIGDPKNGSVISMNDLSIGRVTMELERQEEIFDPRLYYEYQAEKANNHLIEKIKKNAGWQKY